MSVQQLDPPQQDQLNAALGSVAQELRRLSDVAWLCPVIDPSDQEVNLFHSGEHVTGFCFSLDRLRIRVCLCPGSSGGLLQTESKWEISSCLKVQEGQKQQEQRDVRHLVPAR